MSLEALEVLCQAAVYAEPCDAHPASATAGDPLIVLDKDLRVIAASRSFYITFATNPDESQGKRLYDFGIGEWNIPELRALLESIIPGRRELDDYEVERDFSHIGENVF